MDEARIRAFFAKTCSQAEAEIVAAFFKAYPEELEHWLPFSDWHSAAPAAMLPEVWAGMAKNLRRQRGQLKVVRRMKQMAVAAGLAGVLFGTYRFFRQPNQPAAAHRRALVSAGPLYRVIRNAQGKARTIVLPDSSRIVLDSGASIGFEERFPPGARNIHLSGQAYFQVVPDKKRPFTVFSGKFSTTALGTEFRVTMSAKDGITVHLFKGKVVIRSTDPGLKGWNRDVVLLPGERMNYDGLLAKTTLKSIPETAGSGAKHPGESAFPRFQETRAGISFNGESLSAALDRMAGFYHQPIAYDKRAVRGMHFSGQISHSDSLGVVLRMIAQMNSLIVDSSLGNYKLKR